MHKILKGIGAVVFFVGVAPALWADDAASATAKDYFLTTDGKNGVSVEYDCGVKTSKSDYCLIHLVDQKQGVRCYGLVSNAKVINPAWSCVKVDAKSKSDK